MKKNTMTSSIQVLYLMNVAMIVITEVAPVRTLELATTGGQNLNKIKME